MGFSKNPLLDTYNPRWLGSAILKVDMTSFFSAEGGPIWIKFRRLVQNDMSTAVMCGNGNQMQNSNMADVWANSMACHPRATYHIAGCCHLVNSLSRFQSHMPHCRVLLFVLSVTQSFIRLVSEQGYHECLTDVDQTWQACARTLSSAGNRHFYYDILSLTRWRHCSGLSRQGILYNICSLTTGPQCNGLGGVCTLRVLLLHYVQI